MSDLERIEAEHQRAKDAREELEDLAAAARKANDGEVYLAALKAADSLADLVQVLHQRLTEAEQTEQTT